MPQRPLSGTVASLADIGWEQQLDGMPGPAEYDFPEQDVSDFAVGDAVEYVALVETTTEEVTLYPGEVKTSRQLCAVSVVVTGHHGGMVLVGSANMAPNERRPVEPRRLRRL